MMDRYNKFKELGVRNIAGYNEKIKSVEDAEAAGYTHMPLLVIIVDEFADLMMVASKEVEVRYAVWHSLQERQESI